MKTAALATFLLLSFNVMANQGELIIHGNFEDDKYCSQQIRKLDCGSPDKTTFNTCVNKRVSELEPKCQDYHLDEMDRQFDQLDSKINL